MKFYLDANGSDGSDPRLVDRVYSDGVRIPMSEPERVLTAKEQDVERARSRVYDMAGITRPQDIAPILQDILLRLSALEAKE